MINKRGNTNSILIESPEGVQYKRNTTHVEQYQKREGGEEQAVETPTAVETPLELIQEEGKKCMEK